MKRLLTILMILCLLTGCAAGALAEVTVTKQPETQTVKTGGSVTFSVKAKGARNSAITWHFISPDGSEDITGRKLSARFSGLKVSTPNTLNIRLKNVPEEMHGWTVYCHLGKASAGLDTDRVLLLIEGKNPQEAEDGPDTAGKQETGEAPAEDPEETEEPEVPEETEEEPEKPNGPEEGEEPEQDGPSASETGSARGSANGMTAAGNGEIRGFDENHDYHYLQLGTYYYEADGEKRPLVWRILHREGNLVQLITEEIIDVKQMINIDDYTKAIKHKFKSRFDEPYEQMDIYFWINGEMTATILEDQDFSAAIIPHKVTEPTKGGPYNAEKLAYPAEEPEPLSEEEKKLFPYGKDLFYIPTYGDMMNEDNGFPHTLSGNTVEQKGEIAVPEAGRRKAFATPYAKEKVQYPEWKKYSSKLQITVWAEYGGASPYWTICRRPGYYMVGIVGGNGHLSWRSMASVMIGVRPAAIVDLSRLLLTGGSGTLKDPWVMEPAE